MDDQELERLLEDLESDRVERKASISDGSIGLAIASKLVVLEDYPRRFQYPSHYSETDSSLDRSRTFSPIETLSKLNADGAGM
jgi:hypothetical protein